MKRLTIAGCLLAVTMLGCVTSYVSLMDSWVGSSEVELVERWGEPDSVVKMQGGKILTYVMFWHDSRKVQNRGRFKFSIDQDGKVVSWSKTNFPDMLFGREHKDLYR